MVRSRPWEAVGVEDGEERDLEVGAGDGCGRRPRLRARIRRRLAVPGPFEACGPAWSRDPGRQCWCGRAIDVHAGVGDRRAAASDDVGPGAARLARSPQSAAAAWWLRTAPGPAARTPAIHRPRDSRPGGRRRTPRGGAGGGGPRRGDDRWRRRADPRRGAAAGRRRRAGARPAGRPRRPWRIDRHVAVNPPRTRHPPRMAGPASRRTTSLRRNAADIATSCPLTAPSAKRCAEPRGLRVGRPETRARYAERPAIRSARAPVASSSAIEIPSTHVEARRDAGHRARDDRPEQRDADDVNRDLSVRSMSPRAGVARFAPRRNGEGQGGDAAGPGAGSATGRIPSR